MTFGKNKNPMIGNLTKDQISNLPAEQQEMIARVVLDESRNRRSTLAKAKGYWGMRLVPTLLWICASSVWFWKRDLEMALPIFSLGLLFLIQFHVAGINRRIDAVLSLMDLDRPDTSAAFRNAKQEAEQ
jgi:hypothetical protein